MPIQIPVTQVGLEASIQAAAQAAGRNLKIDLGSASKSIGSLSQPLGRITGQADDFTKSMEAANARVLAFGASVGVLSAVTAGFKQMINVTIQVEKSLADINSVLGASSGQLNKFKNDIFSIAKETGNSFATVSEAALELSRQGLKSDEVLRRLKDSMILARLSGLDAGSAVEGLTAAVNSFSKTGVTTSEVLNKLSNTAAKFAISERDLIQGFQRSASVAQQAGVSLDELGGIITAVQQKTARGGAVIGNAFKTIFTRIQRPESLQALLDVGAAVTDAQGGILPATKLIENLAQKINGLNDIQRANITEKIGGGFQIGPLLAALDDLTSKTSTFKGATEAMANAGSEAYGRNTALNQTLAAAINSTTVNMQQLANTLGELGVTDNLKNLLSYFSSFTDSVQDLLEGDTLGSDFAKGIIKGIGGVLSGPGLLIFGAIIAKLSFNFIKFSNEALKTFFNIGNSAKELNAVQTTITNTLLNNKNIQSQILALEGDRVAQAKFFSTALNTQLATMEKMRSIAASIAPAVVTGTNPRSRRAADGYMPSVMAESSDIKRGVGGAKPSDKPVVIPNFNFGGGKKGTMVANSGEYLVPNFANGGSAIFNREMVGRMGLPSNAQKINSAGGFIPNFVGFNEKEYNSYLGKFKSANPEDLKRYSSGLGRNQTAEYKKAAADALALKNSKALNLDSASVLNIDSNRLGGLGVVSVSGGTGYVSTSESRGDMSPSEVKFLDDNFGKNKIKTVSISNIQSKSLGNLDASLKKDNQSAFRDKIKQNFSAPLVKLGDELIGKALVGNDRAEYASKLSSATNDPALFSDSVLGGIFESAIRVATKTVEQIGAFKDVDANSPFDFEEGGRATDAFKNAFKFEGDLFKADAKKTANAKTIRTIIGKSLRDGEVSGRIKSNYGRKVSSKIAAKSADGYIPNFADALKEAISREISAGLDPSQVYIDQSNSLKNAGNPMGLMVANRRDEPQGGFQGIARARKEGANAQFYGAADGFVPNFAPQLGQVQRVDLGRTQISDQSITNFNNSLKQISDQLRKGSISFSDATLQVNQLAKSSGSTKAQITKLGTSGQALIAAYNNELEARNKKAQELKQQRASGSSSASAPAKESRDFLGVIFAAQAGLSALAGATSDATSNLGKISNILINSASSFTTAAFAIQGISGLGGAIGSFASKLGPYGLAIAGTVALISAAGNGIDQITGVTDRAADAMARVADASEKAAYKLSDYGQTDQRKITKDAEDLISGAVRYKTNGENQIADFEGFDPFPTIFGGGKLQKALQESVKTSLAGGVSYDKIFKEINSVSKEGLGFSTETVDELIDKFSRLSAEANKSKMALQKFYEVEDNKKAKNRLAEIPESRFERILKADRKLGGFKEERAILAAEGNTGFESQNKALRDERKRIQEESASELTKEQEFSVNIQASGEKVLLEIMKKRLDIALELRDVYYQMPTGSENQLNIEKELNSTLESRKIQIDNQLEANKRIRDLVSEQVKNVSSTLTDKAFEGQAFGSLDPTGKVDVQEYTKVNDIIASITSKIQKQGGWNEQIKNDLDAQLKTLKKQDGSVAVQDALREKIVTSLSQENMGLQKTMSAKNMIADIEQKRLAIAKSTNFIQDQANKNSISNLSTRNSELDIETRIAKARLDLKKSQIEGGAIGGSNYAKAGSQAQIIKAEQALIVDELKRSNEKIVNDLQKALLEKAFEIKLESKSINKFKKEFEELKVNILLDGKVDPAESEKLKTLGTDFAKQIDDARKAEAINALKASFEKKTADLQAISTTLDSANRFSDIIVESANKFLSILNINKPEGTSPQMGPISTNPFVYKSPIPEPFSMVPIPNEPDFITQQKRELEKQLEANVNAIKTSDSEEGIENLRNIIGELEVPSIEASTALQTATNALNQLGADAVTFSNLVGNAFKNLREEAAQNQFSLLSATSADSLVSGGMDRLSNMSLQGGPPTEDTIKNTANNIALLSKRLDYETAIDSATKSRLKFEYDQTVKILALKEELLGASTSQETEAILRKIKDVSQTREGVASRLSSVFNPTSEESKRNWEDSLVSSSERFRDNIIDGMSQAIENGDSLGDILRSSALDFAREMTKANIKNLTGGITGGVGSILGFASGGKITGGSGSKDDVPAMLMGGEYVINKKSVSKYGSAFMESLNNGTLQGFAKGGSVIRGRGINSDVISNTDPGFQTGKGGFQMPGYYGQGTISGKKDLLSFATQAYTSGANDIISSGSNSSYIDLEGESVRLTNFGRRNGPMANAIRESKGQAFDLYKQQLAAEKQAREEEKARKEAFRNSIKMALISTAVGVVGRAASSGFQAGATSAGQDATMGERFGAGFKGIFSGGDIGGGVQSGGIKNLFSGNFALSQISSSQELSSYLNTNPNSDFAKQLRLNSPEMFDNGKFIERALPFGSNYSLFNGSSLASRASTDSSLQLPFLPPDGVGTITDSPLDGSLLPPKSGTTRRATGGLIPSAGGIDTVPAMLSGGEFIMNAAATQRIGSSNLNAMNSGSSNTDSKDLNDKLISKLDELITASKESSKGVTVNVTSDGRGNTQESTEGQGSSDQDKNLSRKIKAAVVSVLQEEKRLGGVLRRR